jgi:hypothetical protein
LNEIMVTPSGLSSDQRVASVATHRALEKLIAGRLGSDPPASGLDIRSSCVPRVPLRGVGFAGQPATGRTQPEKFLQLRL